MPVNENENWLYRQSALASKYLVPSGPRDSKGLNFSPIFIKIIFFYLFPSQYKKKLSVLQPKSERKKGA